MGEARTKREVRLCGAVLTRMSYEVGVLRAQGLGTHLPAATTQLAATSPKPGHQPPAVLGVVAPECTAPHCTSGPAASHYYYYRHYLRLPLRLRSSSAAPALSQMAVPQTRAVSRT
ncbi:hypothetical protein NDU88_002814 [Pleurodeles waltl]|uniref:Uncharacterized protein n=1 Tax=Pleurodeles waltl TaxID=8319 RepID=A0AAV7RC30_PLEWA|nr:hypothetical protein NDU88_002814 [Pleurodeles waltl]